MFGKLKNNLQRLRTIIKEGHINLKGDIYYGKYKDQNEQPERGYFPFSSKNKKGDYVYAYTTKKDVSLGSNVRPLTRQEVLKGFRYKKNLSVLDDTVTKVYGEAFQYKNGNVGINVTDARPLFVNKVDKNNFVCRSNEVPPEKMGRLRRYFYGKPDNNEGKQHGYEHFATKANTADIPVYGYYPYDCLDSIGSTVPLSTREQALDTHLQRSRDKQRNYKIGDSIYKVFGKTVQGRDKHLMEIEHATPVYLEPTSEGYNFRSKKLNISAPEQENTATLNPEIEPIEESPSVEVQQDNPKEQEVLESDIETPHTTETLVPAADIHEISPPSPADEQAIPIADAPAEMPEAITDLGKDNPSTPPAEEIIKESGKSVTESDALASIIEEDQTQQQEKETQQKQAEIEMDIMDF